jgi:asparagine synthase (glutamine-hydrolysing)
VRGKETKRILKAAFAKILPDAVIKRKKAGFPVPYETWLRRDLKDVVADVLLSNCAMSRDYFRRDEVIKLLGSNAANGSLPKEVFSLLTLELWHRQFLDCSIKYRATTGPERPAIRVTSGC